MSDKPRKPLPTPRTITLPDQKTYQPPKAEREREYDMPGVSLKKVRSAFFRPINVRRKPRD